LAPADPVCGSCGQPVAVAQRLALMAPRAEGYAAAGQYVEAARSAEAVLALPLADPDAKRWWRKRGAWLQRAGRPELLDAAEAALERSVRLDDADDLGHQLWIDLLQRLGRLDKARAWYKARLQADPEDAVAQRQLAALRLLEDFKLAPPPKLNLPEVKDRTLMKALRPTPWKLVCAGAGLLSCVFMLYSDWTGSAAGPPLPDGMESMASIMKLASDPWFNGVQILAYGAYLLWGWRQSRGQ
jgi:tetratricopeptide (TPR) repeat protein